MSFETTTAVIHQVSAKARQSRIVRSENVAFPPDATLAGGHKLVYLSA